NAECQTSYCSARHAVDPTTQDVFHRATSLYSQDIFIVLHAGTRGGIVCPRHSQDGHHRTYPAARLLRAGTGAGGVGIHAWPESVITYLQRHPGLPQLALPARQAIRPQWTGRVRTVWGSHNLII